MRVLTVLSVCSLVALSLSGWSQTENPAKEKLFATFQNLASGKGSWTIKAAFDNNEMFEQRIEFEAGANGQMFHARTYQKDASGDFVLHSEGIRAWDPRTRSMQFWDVNATNGMMTQGTVVMEGENILYIYEYGGEILTDMFVPEPGGDIYEIIIGVKNGDSWSAIYANGGFYRDK